MYFHVQSGKQPTSSIPLNGAPKMCRSNTKPGLALAYHPKPFSKTLRCTSTSWHTKCKRTCAKLRQPSLGWSTATSKGKHDHWPTGKWVVLQPCLHIDQVGTSEMNWNMATQAMVMCVVQNLAGWWFQPLWKIFVNWDDYSQYMQK